MVQKTTLTILGIYGPAQTFVAKAPAVEVVIIVPRASAAGMPVLVADRYGRILAELEGDIEFVTWRFNEVGKATFHLPRRGAKTTLDNLRFGNRILFQFSNGLPAWGGVIDPPRAWDRDIITVNAYSGEKLFEYRQTGKGRYFTDVTVGAIFESVIAENALDLVELGQIWKGGAGHYPEYHFENLLSIIRDSICGTLSEADFTVTAREEGGYIKFTANLYERRGLTLPAVVLIEDMNVTTISLSEQGPITNSWDVAGAGDTWGDERLTARREDSPSRNEFGLRQDSEISDATLQGTIDATADVRLAETKQPRNLWTLDVLNLAPARFAAYDVADVITLQAPSYGFSNIDHSVQVITREYRPAQIVCTLVVEENPVEIVIG